MIRNFMVFMKIAGEGHRIEHTTIFADTEEQACAIACSENSHLRITAAIARPADMKELH